MGYRRETVLRQASLYKGVWQNRGHWRVCVTHGGRRIYPGSYDTEEAAARVYDKKALDLNGRCATWQP